MLLGGITNVLSIFAKEFWSLSIYAGLYGVFKGNFLDYPVSLQFIGTHSGFFQNSFAVIT